MTLRSFLEWCERNTDDRRYELVDGQPVALARPPRRHNRLVTGDSRTRFARLYRRNEVHAEQLSMLPDRIAGEIDLQSIDLTISLDQLYADARIPVPS